MDVPGTAAQLSADVVRDQSVQIQKEIAAALARAGGMVGFHVWGSGVASFTELAEHVERPKPLRTDRRSLRFPDTSRNPRARSRRTFKEPRLNDEQVVGLVNDIVASWPWTEDAVADWAQERGGVRNAYQDDPNTWLWRASEGRVEFTVALAPVDIRRSWPTSGR